MATVHCSVHIQERDSITIGQRTGESGNVYLLISSGFDIDVYIHNREKAQELADKLAQVLKEWPE